MKTLCIAVVVLSLSSVCQPASLACDKLLKPVDKAPDLSGTWYTIALSTESCLVSTLLNSAFWPSIEVNIRSKDTPNIYNATMKYKIFGYCETESEEFLFDNNNMFEIDSNNAAIGIPDVLLQTGCPDCMVIKRVDDDIVNTFMLFSRRKTITAAELKEFESQAECIGWSKPQVLNSDHGGSCLSIDDYEGDGSELSSLMSRRLKKTYPVIFKCLAETTLYYPNIAFKWAQQQWESFW